MDVSSRAVTAVHGPQLTRRSACSWLVALRPDRLQRLLLFGTGAAVLLGAALAARRDYADAWILDGILLPYAAFVTLAAVAMIFERSSAVVALLSAAFVTITSMVPGLKYVQPYGVTLDSVQHFQSVTSLVETGHLLPANTYAAIGGQHSWLASWALATGISPSSAVAIGPALCAGILPLLVYWLCRESGTPAHLIKRALLLACLAGPPAYMLNGTIFSIVPLLMTVGAVILQSFYGRTPGRRRAYSVIAVLGIVQLVFWHSTTPLLLPIVLLAVSLTPIVASFVRGGRPSFRPAWDVVGFAVLAAALFVGYHALVRDRVFVLMIEKTAAMLEAEGNDALLPQRFFDIPFLAKINVAFVLHGRDLLLFGLSFLGLLLVINQVRRRLPQSDLLVALVLVCATYGILIFAPIPGVSYQRFILMPVALAPFFGAPALYWLETRCSSRVLPLTLAPFFGAPALYWLKVRRSGQVLPVYLVFRTAAAFVVSGLLLLWTIQIFPCQPLVPQVDVLGTHNTEYVLWVHEANSAQQARMLAFAESFAPSQARFAADLWSARQFQRYFGTEGSIRRTMTRPLQKGTSLISIRANYFLLHWPGAAGGLGESWEDRSRERIAALREIPDWSVVYDNGDSFVLSLGHRRNAQTSLEVARSTRSNVP